MPTKVYQQLQKPQSCPHCACGFLAWDERDHEHFCFNCGWRISVRITAEEAQTLKKWKTSNALLTLQRRTEERALNLDKNWAELLDVENILLK
jgi:hypothetical protein